MLTSLRRISRDHQQGGMSMGNVFIGVIAVFLLLGAFSTPILNGIKTWRTDGPTTQLIAVTTAGGVTSANVTLTKDLYQASVDQITSITSPNGSDTPVGSSYTESSKVLNIVGLADGTTRNLTLTYYGESDQSIMRIIGPFLGFFIIGGLLVLLVMGAAGKGRRR